MILIGYFDRHSRAKLPARLGLRATGDQFWEASDPPLSQATLDDIKFLTQRLRPGSETELADLGCGSGCVGRYLAKDFDTDVEGIDANPVCTENLIGVDDVMESPKLAE
jgi:2-polyprenyl-3-methyl-5-hydroxy-6-metoxy-1,4-benzoquinol methylase